MKKLCILLALALVLAAVPAYAAEGDAMLGRGEDTSIYFRYTFTDGETLYLNAYGSLYSWRVGDADLTEHALNWPESSDDSSLDAYPFISDGQLYALVQATSYTESDSQFEGTSLYAMNPGENGAFDLEKVCDVDWSDLTEYYSQSSYGAAPESVIGAPGKAVIRCYDASGSYNVRTIDLKTGEVSLIDALRDTFALTRYRDGTLLAEIYSYEDSGVARFVAFDPADESVQPLAELEINDYSPLSGLAYDAQTDTLYCVKGGEICPVDLQTGEVREGVTDMPLESYGDTGACVLNGGYFAFCSEGAVIRNLDPGQKADIRLKICDSMYNDSVNTAYYHFSNQRGDVSVVLSHDWNEAQMLLENMMNHDDSVDIYVMQTDSSIYDALYRRGYLMELDGGEHIAALAERMYPTLREDLSTNGHLVALPVDMYAWGLGVNEKALEALGMTIDDVPDNMWDFLDFLPTLAGPLSENPHVTFVYPGYTEADARNDLFNYIFEDYQRYVNVVDPQMGYDNDLLRGLLKKLEGIDFMALGCPEAEEEEDDAHTGRTISYDVDENNLTLFDSSTNYNIGAYYGDFTPLLLKLDANTPECLAMYTTVAFVNPYTRHPDVALAFMDELAQSLSTATQYNLFPDLNEPVRGIQNQQNLEDAQQLLESTRAELAEADEADRQMLEEMVKEQEEGLAYWEENAWEVSQREIDWYRAHDDAPRVTRVNWLYSDESGEAWDLMQQYREGVISLDEMLAAIDRKVQMMMLEGN